MFLLCFRALSTQQGGYVRATNLYYYYYGVTANQNDINTPPCKAL